MVGTIKAPFDPDRLALNNENETHVSACMQGNATLIVKPYFLIDILMLLKKYLLNLSKPKT